MKRILLLLGAAQLTLAGCSIFTPARIDSAAEAAACVLLNREIAPEQVAIRCGMDILDVFKIQKAQNEATAKQMKAAKCAP